MREEQATESNERESGRQGDLADREREESPEEAVKGNREKALLIAIGIARDEYEYEGSLTYERYGKTWEALELELLTPCCPQCGGMYELERFLVY